MSAHKTAKDAIGQILQDPAFDKEVEQIASQRRLTSLLTQMRLARNVSQTELARRMKTTQPRICRLESGADEKLQWKDIAGYASALGLHLNLRFEDQTVPVAHRIKSSVIAIGQQLQELCDVLETAEDDEKITGKIKEFTGDVLFNFLTRYADAADRMHLIEHVADYEDIEADISLGDKIEQEKDPVCS